MQTATRTLRNAQNYAAGLAAEQIIAQHYVENGYQLQHSRWRAQGGELDLVVMNKNQLVFCEVKQSKTFDRALDRMTATKQKRILRTAQAYMAKHNYDQMTDIRFDVCLVDGQGNTQIMENVFMG